MNKSFNTPLVILIILAAVFACYGATLFAGFVWDDEFLIIKNSLLRAPIWSFQVFKQDIINSGFTYTIYYRPIQILSYAVDWRLWGIEAAGFHFTSVFLHFLNCVSVFFFARLITDKKAVAFLAAFFFAVHPAATGAVSYISSRTDLLFFLFGFLGLIFYVLSVKEKRRIFLAASSVFLVLSLFSKEAAIVFPFLFLLTGTVVLKENFWQSARNNTWNFLIVFAYASCRWFCLGNRPRIFEPVGIVKAFIDSLAVIKASAALFLLPGAAHMRRELAFAGTNDAAMIFAVALLVIAFFYSRMEKRLGLFSIGFFLIALFPFFLVTGQFKVFGEHWAYLASFGMFFFIAFVLTGVFERGRTVFKCLVAGVLLLYTIFSASSVIDQNKFWRSDIALSDRVLETSQKDTSAVYYKAARLAKEGKRGLSAGLMTMYADTKGNDPAALYLKGRFLISSGDVDGAERDFKKALSMDDGYFNGYVGLAMVSFLKKDNENAIAHLEKAIKLNPKDPEAFYLLSGIYLEAGNFDKALKTAERANKVDPYGYNTLTRLGETYARSGNLKEGAKYYLRAVRLYPEEPVAYYGLGCVFLTGGNKDEGRKWLKKAVMKKPDFGPAVETLRKVGGTASNNKVI